MIKLSWQLYAVPVPESTDVNSVTVNILIEGFLDGGNTQFGLRPKRIPTYGGAERVHLHENLLSCKTGDQPTNVWEIKNTAASRGQRIMRIAPCH